MLDSVNTTVPIKNGGLKETANDSGCSWSFAVFVIIGVVGVVIATLGATDNCGETGSPGFVASTAGGGTLVIVGIVGGVIFYPSQPSLINVTHNNGVHPLVNLKDQECLINCGEGSRRVVHRIKNTDLVIKSSNSGCVVMTYVQCECLMYEISERFGFGVVPFTQYIVPESEDAQLIAERCPTLNHPMIFQKFLVESNTSEINIDQAHKAILFTWITGRSDTKRDNSVVDERGMVWEVDNEICASPLKWHGVKSSEQLPLPKVQESHWLLSNKAINQPISNKLLVWILSLDDQIELRKENLPAEFKWNVIVSFEQKVASNLALLKTVIRNLLERKIPITFDLLKIEIGKFPDHQ